MIIWAFDAGGDAGKHFDSVVMAGEQDRVAYQVSGWHFTLGDEDTNVDCSSVYGELFVDRLTGITLDKTQQASNQGMAIGE